MTALALTRAKNPPITIGLPSIGNPKVLVIPIAFTDYKAEVDMKEKLEKELAETKDSYMRVLAEYDNFRKRSAKERLEITAMATGNAIGEILPVIDNFERALQTETQDESYKAGVQMIFNQFMETIKKLNVEVIDPTGETFDPNIANAVNQIEDPELGENVWEGVDQSNVSLYVSKDLVEDFKMTDQWKEFKISDRTSVEGIQEDEISNRISASFVGYDLIVKADVEIHS